MSIFRTLDALPVARAQQAVPPHRPSYRFLAAQMRALASQARSLEAGQELLRLAELYDRLTRRLAGMRA